MATMGSYCKAYAADRFAEFAGWRENPVSQPQPQIADPGDGADQSNERYLFLQENYVVTAGVFLDEEIVFDDVTEEWKRFCVETLKFSPVVIDAPAGGDMPSAS